MHKSTTNLRFPYPLKTEFKLMEASEYDQFKQYEGTIFCYKLTKNMLWLTLFRILPLGWVRLSKVDTMRTSHSKEFFELTPHRMFIWWKYWHWPYSLSMIGRRDKQIYLLETRGGYRVFVRLRTGMHYMLRTLIAEAQEKHNQTI